MYVAPHEADDFGYLTKRVRRLSAELRKTPTWDRGLEMAAHADPGSPLLTLV
jgi:IS30 family transposase